MPALIRRMRRLVPDADAVDALHGTRRHAPTARRGAARLLRRRQDIEIKRAASYFGPVSLKTESKLSEGRIVATMECPLDRGLKRVELRLPHPEGRRPTSVAGGKYNPDTETVTVEPFIGHAEVVLRFGEKD